ncbi:MAG: SpoIIE family protein phosphatase [Bacteroidia bacterium]|jgi:serine phosphatase RsbU (regulator of sigma subunit)/tetratricopeptide (TPR) repeat protein|nr:SpoIIE family protein phosphatase [Bacteroidia bacterium]
MFKNFILTIVFFYSSFSNLSAQNYLDTISAKIKGSSNDSVKIEVYFKYSLRTTDLNQNQCDSIFNLIEEIRVSTKNKYYAAYALIKQGHYYNLKNNNSEAITKYFEGLKLSEKLTYNSGLIIAHNRLGYFYLSQDGKVIIARSHFFSALKFLDKSDNEDIRSDCYSSLGTVYKELENADSSLYFHELALKIRKKLNKPNLMAISYNNIGLTYKMMKNYDKAYEFLLMAMEIRKKNKKEKGYSGVLINIGRILVLKKDFKQALNFLDSGIFYSQKYHFPDFMLKGMKERAELLMKLNQYENSCKAWVIYENKWDSINSEDNKKIISEMQSKYESDTKDQNIKLQQEQLHAQEAENSLQKIILLASSIALLMALIAVFFVYRSYRQNKKNAHELSIKNLLIEEKSKEITDSINYARLIQQSLLASKSMLDNNLQNYFIFYKPKDIVSGDFYWAAESQKGFLIACVDCTGHGVPGAFMSLIGKENLDKAVAKTNNPGEILSELNRGVKRSLNQNETIGNKDGMDAAIIRLEKTKEDKTKLSYSGANRPLYILRKESKDLIEIKATKQAIGGFTNNDQLFEEHEVTLQSGDSIFISTDGYADQFGSTNNKKLTTKRFKDLLISIHSKNAIDQKQTLEDFFKSWKGNLEQLDDLLVIGINV